MFGIGNNSSNRVGPLKKRRIPSRVLVIDWGVGKAVVSEYHLRNADPLCLDSFEIEWPLSAEIDPVEIGRRLALELKSRGITTKQTVVSVPRRFVVFKHLELPARIDDVAEAVYLQCENLFPVARSEMAIDFVVEPAASLTGHSSSYAGREIKNNTHHVLVAAVPGGVFSSITDSLSQAGLKSLAIGIGELGVPLLHQTASLQIDILVAASSAEFVLSRAGFPMQCFTVQFPSDENQKANLFCATVDRLLHAPLSSQVGNLGSSSNGSGSGSEPDHPSRPIHVYGKTSGVLEQAMQMRFAGQFKIFSQQGFAQVKDVALLTSYRDSAQFIDLLNPRQCVDPRARQRRMGALFAGVPAIVLLGIGLNSWMSYLDLEQRLSVVERDRTILGSEITRLQPVEKTWTQVVDFERSKSDYAMELRGMLERFQGNEQMILTSVEINELPSKGGSLMRFKGKVRDRDVFNTVTEAFLSTAQFRLRPPLLESIRGDDQYSFEFTYELETNAAKPRAQVSQRTPSTKTGGRL